MPTWLRTISLFIILITLTITANQTSGQDTFTLAIIPDTQREMSNPHRTDFANRMQWLVANSSRLNLKMVLHVGDLTDWDTSDHVQYIRASDGFALLDQAGIPYAIAIGNHDTAAVKPGGSAADGDVKANVRITTTFNRYFPPTRFKNLTQTFQKDQSDNAVHQFSAGELDFLVLNLELWPRTHIIEWAKKIVSNNPQHNVIILTHSYLDANGNILQHNGGYGANSPQYLYDKLISQYPNIKLVFCGHAGQSLHRIDTGDNGNTIATFLQCIHDPKTNPVRLLTIDRATGSMKSSIYCPWTNEYRNDGSSTISDMKWLSKSQNELQNAETK